MKYVECGQRDGQREQVCLHTPERRKWSILPAIDVLDYYYFGSSSSSSDFERSHAVSEGSYLNAVTQREGACQRSSSGEDGCKAKEYYLTGHLSWLRK